MHAMKPVAATLLILALLPGCKDREAEAAAQAAAATAASEQAAADAERAFEAAVADGNWALAKAQGDILFARWPTTEAAERVRPKYEEARSRGDAENEARRVAALDRKSTRLNSSHVRISYAVFCLKKKKTLNTSTECNIA